MKVTYPIKIVWRDRFRFELVDNRNLCLFRSMVENGDHYFINETKTLLENMCAGVNAVDTANKVIEQAQGTPKQADDEATCVKCGGTGKRKKSTFDRAAHMREVARKRWGKK